VTDGVAAGAARLDRGFIIDPQVGFDFVQMVVSERQGVVNVGLSLPK